MWSKYCSVVVGRDKVAEVAAAGPPLNDSVINCVKQKKKKARECSPEIGVQTGVCLPEKEPSRSGTETRWFLCSTSLPLRHSFGT